MSKDLKEFEKEKETWQRFVQRVRLYFISTGVPDNAANVEKRRAILLQGMGIDLFNKYCDSTGDGLANLTFDEIVTGVETLVNPPPLEISERYRFHTRTQQPNESAADYMVALRKIALTCNFANDIANNADPTLARLRDQFVCGLAKKEMQRHLLQQPELKFDNVVRLAQSFESAETTTALLSNGQKSESEVKVNSVMRKSKAKFESKLKGKSELDSAKLEGRNGKKKWGKCKHCGKEDNHPSEKCFYKDAECFVCGERGHIATVCPEKEEESEKKDSKRSSVGYMAKGEDQGDSYY